MLGMICCSFNVRIREFRSRVTPSLLPALAHISISPLPSILFNLHFHLKQHTQVSNQRIRPFIIGTERYRPGPGRSKSLLLLCWPLRIREFPSFSPSPFQALSALHVVLHATPPMPGALAFRFTPCSASPNLGTTILALDLLLLPYQEQVS